MRLNCVEFYLFKNNIHRSYLEMIHSFCFSDFKFQIAFLCIVVKVTVRQRCLGIRA